MGDTVQLSQVLTNHSSKAAAPIKDLLQWGPRAWHTGKRLSSDVQTAPCPHGKEPPSANGVEEQSGSEGPESSQKEAKTIPQIRQKK